jgi:hypothetical protein
MMTKKARDASLKAPSGMKPAAGSSFPSRVKPCEDVDGRTRDFKLGGLYVAAVSLRNFLDEVFRAGKTRPPTLRPILGRVWLAFSAPEPEPGPRLLTAQVLTSAARSCRWKECVRNPRPGFSPTLSVSEAVDLPIDHKPLLEGIDGRGSYAVKEGIAPSNNTELRAAVKFDLDCAADTASRK